MPVDEYLNFVPVKAGDFIPVPVGAVHTVGKGVTLCEIQQASDSTFRIWDWNRLDQVGDSRELHIEQAKEVLNFSDSFNEKLLASIQNDLLSRVGISSVIDIDDFAVQLISNTTQKQLELNLENKDAMIVLSGQISGDINLKSYESSIVLEKGIFTFELARETSFLIVSENNRS